MPGQRDRHANRSRWRDTSHTCHQRRFQGGDGVVLVCHDCRAGLGGMRAPPASDDDEDDGPTLELNVEPPASRASSTPSPILEEQPSEPVLEEQPSEPVLEEQPSGPVLEEQPREGGGVSSEAPPPPLIKCEEHSSGVVPGGRARLSGLKSRPDLNGEEVLVIRWHCSTSRWLVGKVCRDGGAWPTSELRVATDNLVPCEVPVLEMLCAAA